MPEENRQRFDGDGIEKLIQIQHETEKKKKALREQYPDVFAQLDEIEQTEKDLSDTWEAVKADLIAKEDFDVHEVLSVKSAQRVRFSVSKVVKIGIDNVDEVPEEFVVMKKVADTDRIKQYYELYGKLPEGCSDKSYYRLNKKDYSIESLGRGII